jgi:ribosomal protein L1
MAKLSKRIKAIRDKIESTRQYDFNEGISLIK